MFNEPKLHYYYYELLPNSQSKSTVWTWLNHNANFQYVCWQKEATWCLWHLKNAHNFVCNSMSKALPFYNSSGRISMPPFAYFCKGGGRDLEWVSSQGIGSKHTTLWYSAHLEEMNRRCFPFEPFELLWFMIYGKLCHIFFLTKRNFIITQKMIINHWGQGFLY